MRKHQKELFRWKALAILVTILIVFLAVENKSLSDRYKGLAATEQKLEKEVHNLQEANKKLNTELEQTKRDKAKAEAQAISRQRTVEQSAGSRAVQLLGSCDHRINTATSFAQADTSLVSQEIDRVFGAQASLAKAVFTSESGLRSNACSPTNDWGVCQVNRTAHPQYSVETLMDYKQNIQACWAISSSGTNFRPWSDFKNGNYLKYI